MRHLVLRLKPVADDGGVTESWPWRNLLLVEDGSRLVLEATAGPVDPRRPEGPHPAYRVSTSAGGVVEIWTVPDPDPPKTVTRGPLPASWDDPCGGGWTLFFGGDASARIEAPGPFTRTMRSWIADVRDAALAPEDAARLETVLRVEAPRPAPPRSPHAPRLAAALLLADRLRRGPAARYVLTPSARPPGDLAPWRALTEIPTSLPPFVLTREAGS